MTTEHSSPSEEPTLDWATAEDAYHIINGLLAGVGAAGDVIALLEFSATMQELAKERPDREHPDDE